MKDENNRDPKRVASLARLARALEGLSPQQIEQATQIAAKLLARRARRCAVGEVEADKCAEKANVVPPLPSPSQDAPQQTQPDRPKPTLKMAPPIFESRVVDCSVIQKLDWD